MMVGSLVVVFVEQDAEDHRMNAVPPSVPNPDYLLTKLDMGRRYGQWERVVNASLALLWTGAILDKYWIFASRWIAVQMRINGRRRI